MARVTQAITKQIDASLNDADKQLTVPAGAEWEVLSVLVEIISDATVGNRQLEVTAVDELGNLLWKVQAGPLQAASLTRRYVFGAALPHEAAFVGDTARSPIPPTILAPGWGIRARDSAGIALATDDMTIRASLRSA